MLQGLFFLVGIERCFQPLACTYFIWNFLIAPDCITEGLGVFVSHIGWFLCKYAKPFALLLLQYCYRDDGTAVTSYLYCNILFYNRVCICTLHPDKGGTNRRRTLVQQMSATDHMFPFSRLNSLTVFDQHLVSFDFSIFLAFLRLAMRLWKVRLLIPYSAMQRFFQSLVLSSSSPSSSSSISSLNFFSLPGFLSSSGSRASSGSKRQASGFV